LPLLPQHRIDIPAAPKNMKNQNVLASDAIDDDVFADGKTAEARPQIFIAVASNVRVAGKKISAMESTSRSAISTLPFSLAT
jgi:hypothetical protein